MLLALIACSLPLSGEGVSGGDARASGKSAPASCADVLAADPTAADGVYALTLGGAAVETWCRMSLAGGGWTLAATNGWGGAWTASTILTAAPFGDLSLTTDHQGPAFGALPFRDLLFETDAEWATYLGVGDGTRSFAAWEATIPVHNCGVDTPFRWPMADGTFADDALCDTDLYLHPRDWEGGDDPCGDAESATGPAWSGTNKSGDCPLDDPQGTSFIADTWDYNPWGDHDPATPNLPLRMWVR